MVSPGFSVFSSNSPYERLISSIIRTEREPQHRLKGQKKTQENLKKIIGSLDSKLSALNTALTPFSPDATSSPFSAMTADVGDTNAFTATASDSASIGSHSLKVEQLAQTDTRISTSLAASGTDIADTFNGNNASKTFTIDVAHPTDADSNNREQISVTVDTISKGETNDSALKKIKTAVDSAMNSAVDAGTINEDEKVSVSVLNETSSDLRLSIQSAGTGFTNRITLADAGGKDDLLTTLDINDDHASYDSGGGGMVYAVGTNEKDSELNSRFMLDGVTMYRDSNTVTDALEGITLNLKQAGGSESSFSVDTDTETVTDKISAFIEKFNAAQDFLKEKTNVDEEKITRAPLAGDFTLRNLRMSLRNDAVTEVSGQPADGPSYLSELGITIDDNGKLELEDKTKLTDAIEDNIDAVESLFSGDDGVATRMQNRLDQFIKFDGIIDNREKTIESRVSRLSDRIDNWDDKLQRREEQLRDQFAQVQKIMQQYQSQQQSFGMFGGGF